MSTLPIHGLEVFLAIARDGSLRAAARSLGLAPSAVSHRLKKLEREIGVDLFARTTRSIELTQAGRTLLRDAGPMIAGLAAAIEGARGVGRARSGTLRLTLPWSAYKIAIAPVIGTFHDAYPDIRLELSFDEALVDVVRDGFHAGIRLGDRLTPGMVAVRLTPSLKGAFTATPGYLDAHGRPEHPRDLLVHKCLRYKFISTNRIADWQFWDDGQLIVVDPPAFLVINSFQSVVQAACDGHGIGWSLRAVVADELASGALESVLDRYVLEHPPFYLYFPEQNRRSELLRVFIDFLAGARSRGGSP